MRHIDEIIIHTSATRPEWMYDKSAEDKVAEIRRWHKAKGWRDIGYHYVVDRDGVVVPGRPLEQQGAHVRGHNQNTIGVCLFGGHGSSENDAFQDNFTYAQEQALRLFLRDMQTRIPAITKITGHNQYAAKACPGFNVPRWLANQSAERTSLLSSTTAQASTASMLGGAGTVGTAITALEGDTQRIALVLGAVIVLAGMWIFRERLQKWARGVR